MNLVFHISEDGFEKVLQNYNFFVNFHGFKATASRQFKKISNSEEERHLAIKKI